METSFTPNAFTIVGFCRAYGIGRSLTYAEIASGRLKARKVGNRTLILRADAETWSASLKPVVPKGAQ